MQHVKNKRNQQDDQNKQTQQTRQTKHYTKSYNKEAHTNKQRHIQQRQQEDTTNKT